MSQRNYRMRFFQSAALCCGRIGIDLGHSLASRGRSRSAVQRLRQAIEATELVHRVAEAPGISATELLGGKSDDDGIRLLSPTAGAWNVTLQELAILAELVRHRLPQRIFEFGTFDARTTINLLINATDETTVVTLDLPPDVAIVSDTQVIGRRTRERADLSPRIEQISLDSAKLTDQMDERGFRNAFDLIFIDADHRYEAVRRDSLSAKQMLADGGCIVWHDYWRHLPVTRAVDELREQDAFFADVRRVLGTSLAILQRRQQRVI